MNPYQQYQQQMVTTMTQGDMLLKLYDETIKQIELARAAIENNETAAMDKAITKAERIIQYLRSTLDFRYPVSSNLVKLYDFFNTQLVMASVKKDAKILDDIEPLVAELRDTFGQCVKIDRVNRLGSVAGTVGGAV